MTILKFLTKVFDFFLDKQRKSWFKIRFGSYFYVNPQVKTVPWYQFFDINLKEENENQSIIHHGLYFLSYGSFCTRVPIDPNG
jgi:hypothetical protein